MLASLGNGDAPQRKENVHSNKLDAANNERRTEKPKQKQQTKVSLHPKLSQRQGQHQPSASPSTSVNEAIESTHNYNVQSPLIATPSAPFSSIKINLPDHSVSSSNETARRELFQSPLSTVSSSIISSDSSAGSEDDTCVLSTLQSTNKTRSSNDSRSIVSEEDETCSKTSSRDDDSESDIRSVNEVEEDSNASSVGNSVVSYEDSVPQYEYEDDDEYSVEMEDSEDELEFDEESDDDMVGKKKGGKNKSRAKKSKGKSVTDDAASESSLKQNNRTTKSVATKNQGKKKYVSKKSENSDAVDESIETIDQAEAKEADADADDESMESRQSDDHNNSISDDERKENSCDFEESLLEETSQESQNEPAKEITSYISTLQHTQIKTSKSSFKRHTKTATPKEPPMSQILHTVDELFQMIEDIDVVTVSDIVHSVEQHFRLSKMKKATKKAIKTRLTELICAKAAGVEVARPRNDEDDEPEGPSKPRKRAVSQKRREEKPGTHSSEPSESDVIAVVDQLFKKADSDTVYFSDIVRSVATQFGLSNVGKTKRVIRARFIELMNLKEAHANSEANQHSSVEESALGDHSLSELDGKPRSPSAKSPESTDLVQDDLGEHDEGDGSNVSFGEVDGSLNVTLDDDCIEIPNERSSISPNNKNANDESCAGEFMSGTNNLAAQVKETNDQSFSQKRYDCEPSDLSNYKSDKKESSLSNNAHANTPQNDMCLKISDSLNASVDSRDKSLVGEHFKCNESFTSCETTLFKNLSPECVKSMSNTNESVDNLMRSMSLSDSLNSTNDSRRIKTGKWSLGKEIGSGSFGVVHVGMNTMDGSFMAIKVLRIPSKNKTAIVQELQREIDLMRSLNHPNIVRYLGAEVNSKSNILNIFQEWVPGGSISSLLKQLGPFSVDVVRLYTAQILKGLEYLHSHNIIHRDIKGGNILISNDGSVKLADFGASKRVEAFGADPDKVMEELTVRGTPYFMAPEVFEEKYGPKADIWSVGGVVFQMATGSPPWKNLGHKNPISLFFHLKNTQNPPELPPTIDDDNLKDLISQCFHRDPSKRPNAKTLLNDAFLSISVDADLLNSPEKMSVNESCSIDAPISPRVSSPNTSMSDSLCYSLTLPAPLHVDKHIKSDLDISDWPDWAKRSYELSRNKPTTNPFSRKASGSQ